MLAIKTFKVTPIEANCYVAYDDEAMEGVLIDPGEYLPEIAEFIEKKGIKIKYTVNTHGHYDHIGGDKGFGFPVAIHEEDKECLNSAVRNLSLVSGYAVSSVPCAKALEDGDSIEAGALTFRVVHTPGHSPGGIALECGDALFTGDTLFMDGIGRTDLPFSDGEAMKRSLKKLMRYEDGVKVYPGHGPSSTIGRERASVSYRD